MMNTSERAAEYQKMDLRELAEIIRLSKRVVFITGAGISYSIAPLAKEIKNQILNAILTLANTPDACAIVNNVKRDSERELNELYLTLELFIAGLRHRVPDLRPLLSSLYNEIFRIPFERANSSNIALAKAVANHNHAVVLTANFDDCLTNCLSHVMGDRFRIVTANSFDDAGFDPSPQASDMCAYHGIVPIRRGDKDINVTPPSSIGARDLAHPFVPKLAEYIRNAFEAADKVIFIGHRGEDYYDLAISIRDYLGPETSEGFRERREKFICVPHQADPGQISTFYEQTFSKSGIALINETKSNNWIAELCELITSRSIQKPISPLTQNSPRIAEKFLQLVEVAASNGELDLDTVRRQCVDFLEDIGAGVFASWSIVEHYRLESLGYSQQVISKFGRPKTSRQFQGLKIAQLIKLQRKYQNFQIEFDQLGRPPDARALPTAIACGEGVKLSLQLEALGHQAWSKSQLADAGREPRPIDKACLTLIAAIAFDYAGLIAMRFGRFRSISADQSPSTLQGAMALIEAGAFAAQGPQNDARAELLFRTSSNLAQVAESQLIVEASRFPALNREQKENYVRELSQIVPWSDWYLAPSENRLRLNCVDEAEKISEYKRLINIRITRMEIERKGSEKSFSAVGNAAQCSLRLVELMRILAGRGSGEHGKPEFDKYLGEDQITDLVESVLGHADECLQMAMEVSSLKQPRFMASYEAKVLAALYLDKADDARRFANDAYLYRIPCDSRYDNWEAGIRSRL